MIRRIGLGITLAIALLCACASASAATKLTQYRLIVDGVPARLSGETGYLFRSGDALLVPVEALCEELGVPYEIDGKRANITMRPDSGAVVKLRVGARTMLVDGRRMRLRVKTGRQAGKLITADARVIKALGYAGKHYKPSASLRKLGYPSGALVLGAKGDHLTPPSLIASDGSEKLPTAIRPAAAESDQIVAIQYSGKRNAAMALYEKIDGTWKRTLSEVAYVGSAGIGKTREGDKKTPTGTFNLTQPFGIKADPGTKMGGYLKVTKNHYWSGQDGPHYNRLVDISKTKDYKPNSKDEHLIDFGSVYNHCLFIDYNAQGEAGKGSAIFLHCQGKNPYTGGCVAVPERVMIKLLEVLDRGAKIVIYP